MKNVINIIILMAVSMSIFGCGDGGSKKWQLDNKNLTQEELGQLKFMLAVKEKFIADGSKWAELRGLDWATMLVFFPEYAKKCDEFKGWQKFNGENWAALLSQEPRFEKECEGNRGWDDIPPEDWVNLISAQPKYLKKAKQLDILKKFSGEDWQNAILSKNADLIKECDSLDAWKKLSNTNWVKLLAEEAIDLAKAEKYSVFDKLSTADWGTLIEKNKSFIDIAKKHNAFSKIDSKTWIGLIAANKDFVAIAQTEGVFNKFTPNEWTDLLIKNPEFVEIARKVDSLKAYSDVQLIRLYVLQPKLRNEIFKIGKIDVDVAKEVERLYGNFGEDGSNLNAKQLIVVLKVFPELKSKVTETTFGRYDNDAWISVLKSGKELYELISQKYAYVIPWKKFEFRDWVEILENNDKVLELFKKNVDIKKLSYVELKNALLDMTTKNSSDVFEKYSIWKELTKDQYVALIADKGREMLGMTAFIGTMSGKKIRSMDDMRGAADSIENKNKATIEKLLLQGDLSGVKDIADKVKSDKNYDKKYVFEKAKDNSIIKSFSNDDWKAFLDSDFEYFSREYLGLYNEKNDIRKMIIAKSKLPLIKEKDLWGELESSTWITIISSVYNDDPKNEELINRTKEFFCYARKYEIFKKIPLSDIKLILVYTCDITSKLAKGENIEDKSARMIVYDKIFNNISFDFWADIPSEVWTEYFDSKFQRYITRYYRGKLRSDGYVIEYFKEKAFNKNINENGNAKISPEKKPDISAEITEKSSESLSIPDNAIGFICKKCSEVKTTTKDAPAFLNMEHSKCAKGGEHDWFGLGNMGKPNYIFTCKKCGFKVERRMIFKPKAMVEIAKKKSFLKLCGEISCPSGGIHEFSVESK